MVSRRLMAVFVAAATAGLIGCNDDEECNSPTSLAIHSGDGQNGPICASLDQVLTVRVQCSNDQPYATGTTVEWQVESGGGSVEPLTSATDATGRASTQLTLGPSPGENVVRATAVNLPPATFIAEAVDPCSFARPFPLGIRAAGELGECDCQFSDGSYIDYLRVNVGQQQTIQFDLTSRDFDPFLNLFDASGVIAGDDDTGEGANSRIRIIMGPGSYRVGANSLFGNVHGAYTLIASTVSSDAAGCEPIWATTGIWTGQRLTDHDCWSEGFYVDAFLIVLHAGQTVTITMTSAEFDPFLCIAPLSTEGGACDDDSGSGDDARVVYTSPADDIYVILAATYWAGGFGRYTLNVSPAAVGPEVPVVKLAPLAKGTRPTGAELNARIAPVLATARQPKPLHRQADATSKP